MMKSQIEKEYLSKLDIKLDAKTLFYMPGETVKGTIKLFPNIKVKTSNNILNFNLKLLQYEFWEYSNKKIDELKNVYKTQIKEDFLEYKLKKEDDSIVFEEVNKHKEEDSIILIEKIEKDNDNDNFYSIPFEFYIDDNNKKLLPTFQFIDDT